MIGQEARILGALSGGNPYRIYIPPRSAYGGVTSRNLPRPFSPSELSQIFWTHSS